MDRIFSVFTSVFTDRLGLRLVVATFLVSTLLSAIASGVQLYSSFERQAEGAYQIVDRITNTSLQPLENALWQLDFEQVDIILRGIQADPAVAHLILKSSTGEVIELGDVDFNMRQTGFTIFREVQGETIEIGTLQVFITLEAAFGRVWAQFVTLILTNLIKAYFLAAALLLICYNMITRHLRKIANEIGNNTDPTDVIDVALERTNLAKGDVIDTIVQALKALSLRSRNQIETLQREVDSRRIAEREARSADEARKRFLANMSHEVRTPLNAIMGLFQLIQMADVPERQKSQATTGLVAANQMLSQLTNVLELSRLEGGALKLHPRPNSTKRLVRHWSEAARAVVTRYNKNIALEVYSAPDLPDVLVIDEKRVAQILTNLCDNAVKFTDEGKLRIDVSTTFIKSKDQTMFCVRISDTGPGIPPGKLSHIFDRFSQIDDSLTRNTSGTGLGLSISAELAELMKGQLKVESPGFLEEYATTFELLLPFITHKMEAA